LLEPPELPQLELRLEPLLELRLLPKLELCDEDDE
jgi:hypothetical protein